MPNKQLALAEEDQKGLRGFMMRCPRCGYKWEPRVPRPKECPRCKGRLDFGPMKKKRGKSSWLRKVGLKRKP